MKANALAAILFFILFSTVNCAKLTKLIGSPQGFQASPRDKCLGARERVGALFQEVFEDGKTMSDAKKRSDKDCAKIKSEETTTTTTTTGRQLQATYEYDEYIYENEAG